VTPERLASVALSLPPDSWTIAAVAEQLSVSPQAVYRLVHGPDQLVSLVTDLVVSQSLDVPRPVPGETLADNLRRKARAVRDCLIAAPGLAEQVNAHGLLFDSPALDLVLEDFLRDLATFGVDPSDANVALDLLLTWAVGWVARHQAYERLVAGEDGDPDDASTPTRSELTALTAARRTFPDPSSWFEWQLSVLAEGLAVALEPPSSEHSAS
jgi:hypothetical protein